MRRWLCLAAIPSLLLGAPGDPPQKMTLREAEETALKNHPALQSAKALEKASLEVPKEVRSRYFPLVEGNVTGSLVNDDTARIFAGGINAPSLYSHLGSGLSVSQLITDFGRTGNLVSSARLQAQAQGEAANTTHADVLLRVDQSYYRALRAQAVLRVAQQTVKARQLVADQTSTLAQSKLRSDLDVTFAKVNLEEALLLLSNAENEERSAMAELSTAVGESQPSEYQLQEEALPGELPPDSAPLIADALNQRPEARQVRLQIQAAEKFAKAERALRYPTLSAGANAGVAPVRPDRFSSDWAAAAVNIQIPIFNGGLFTARRTEAELRMEAMRQQARDVQNRIARDVRVAFLSATNAYKRLQLTAQLLDQAGQSLRLAQSRYDLGLSSIVELSQAQLNVTRAQIAQASAKFDYQAQRASLNYETGALK
ncbi:TolC family protein [uncultured Paludibaculum sp.]|uniref:TolC family protein n=1 Tax=uncultured Paludibaculum sp. TaxID=1765020 RepID=UPI002AABF082|nr:TolC family protein [uncultured Paludibaculum sp.]